MKIKKSTKKSARSRFAENMRITRLAMRFSQEELADRSNLHRTYIGSVERGERNISIDNMEAIANALGCALIDLLSE